MTLTKNLKYFLPAAVVLGVLALAATVYANPFYTGTKAYFSSATSTQTYLIPGVATSSSVIYDSYEQAGTNQTNSGNITIPNTVALLLEGRASSTLTTITATCEFSDNYDSSTGNGDWYQNEIFLATSSPSQTIGTIVSYSFTYASSTVGGGAVASTTNRFQKLVTCPVPLRYVRAVITASGANASVNPWFIPTKQRN